MAPINELKNITQEEWVQTLKGIGPKTYRKAKKSLCNNTGGFCCLGVLADMRGVVWGEDCYRDDGMLDDTVRPNWMNDDDQNKLAKLNDKHAGWEKVIDYIEHEMG